MMAYILQEDRARLLGWGFFDAVLGACWSIEKNSEDWYYFLACAEIIDPMIA